MVKTTVDLMELAKTGTNLVIDANHKTTADLIQIIGAVGLNDGHLKIVNCSSKSTSDLILILGIYPRNVTLDFSQQIVTS